MNKYHIWVSNSKESSDDWAKGCWFDFDNEKEFLNFIKFLIKHGMYFEVDERVNNDCNS